MRVVGIRSKCGSSLGIRRRRCGYVEAFGGNAVRVRVVNVACRISSSGFNKRKEPRSDASDATRGQDGRLVQVNFNFPITGPNGTVTRPDSKRPSQSVSALSALHFQVTSTGHGYCKSRTVYLFILAMTPAHIDENRWFNLS